MTTEVDRAATEDARGERVFEIDFATDAESAPQLKYRGARVVRLRCARLLEMDDRLREPTEASPFDDAPAGELGVEHVERTCNRTK
jgi:hypothetical protein